MSQSSKLASRQSVAILGSSTELGLPRALDNMTVNPPLKDDDRVKLEVRHSLLSASGPALTDGTRCIADGTGSSSNELDRKPESFSDRGSHASLLDGLLFSVAYDLGESPNVVRS
ncbi:hypothetical protein [Bradyrhizobium macuxiense]|uniref:hypothetical protein n=1 Tax=Bradyrhizobium macuxiense TaxID=1755647 RepID=UPI0011BE2204|nr:hypothetical protein [Bradyrhizobium macuxiense]